MKFLVCLQGVIIWFAKRSKILIHLITTVNVYFFFQAEDGIRDVERSRGLGDVYKRQDYRGISYRLGMS